MSPYVTYFVYLPFGQEMCLFVFTFPLGNIVGGKNALEMFMKDGKENNNGKKGTKIPKACKRDFWAQSKLQKLMAASSLFCLIVIKHLGHLFPDTGNLMHYQIDLIYLARGKEKDMREVRMEKKDFFFSFQ